MKWIRTEIIIGIISGCLGALIGITITLWTKLPDHTIDLLAFTESAFGIGLTGLALIVTVGVIQLRSEMEGKFREREKVIEGLQADVSGMFPMVKDAQSRVQFLEGMMLLHQQKTHGMQSYES